METESPFPLRLQTGIMYIFAIVLFVSQLFLGCVSSPSVSNNSEIKNFDAVILNIARQLMTQGQLLDKPVLISPHDFYDLNSKLSLPLAVLLREKMIAAMKKAGARVLLPGVDEDKYLIMSGNWIRQKDQIILNTKIIALLDHGPEAVAAASAPFPPDQIDPILLTPDRESWARYIVRKLEEKARDQNRRSAHIRMFNVSGATGTRVGFGGYLAEWIETALVESRLFIPLDQKSEIKGLPVPTIRTRGTRGIRPVATSLTADLLKSDTEIKGSAWIHSDQVEIRVSIQDRQGRQISAATADVPLALFPENLVREPSGIVETAVPVSSTKHQATNIVSKMGLKLDITTDRGEVRPYYRAGEVIRFIIRLNRTARLYLFDLDPKGRATLLYPVDENGVLLKRTSYAINAGVPLILPEDGSSYDLIVAKPLGKDTVWAVASERELQFPSDLSGGWSNAENLVKRIRSQGVSNSGGYAEAQIEIQTGP